MYEVVSQQLPYQKKIEKFREAGGKGMDMRMIRNISKGLLQPELEDAACSKFRIGRSFIKLFHRCVSYEPRERPEAEEVARKLEGMCTKRLRLKRLVEGDGDKLGDISTLANPEVVEEIYEQFNAHASA